jgi:RimJ/RimL family protein N-acetyltransferase
MIMTGKICRLRAPTQEDIDRWLVWFNDPQVTKCLANLSIYGFTREEEVEFYNRVKSSKNDVVFTIETLKGEQIGTIGLHRINWEWRNAELGIVIGEKERWGKGYCTDAMRLITKFAFDRMNLHRVYLNVSSSNPAGIKCYGKVGYKLEGTLRDNRFYDGNYEDDLVMGILRGELIDS